MKKAIIAVAAMAFSGVALAGPPWTYVDAGYVIASQDGAAGSDGYNLRGSFGFGLFHFGGEYGAVDGVGPVDDIDSYNLYAGVHPAVTENIDLVVDLGYTNTESNFVGGGSAEADGVFLRVGPRALIGDNFELSTYLTSAWGSLDEISDDDDFRGVTLSVGGQWYFTPAFSIGADADLADAGDTINLFGRWSFGR